MFPYFTDSISGIVFSGGINGDISNAHIYPYNILRFYNWLFGLSAQLTIRVIAKVVDTYMVGIGGKSMFLS